MRGQLSTSSTRPDVVHRESIDTRKKTDVSLRRLPKIISLFSGAGGLDLGFKLAGYNIAVAIDISPAAIRTHHRNFGNTKAMVADLVELTPAGVVREVALELSDGESIAVIGGPPCQGFSRANTKSNSNDPRNQLVSLYLEVVRGLQKRYKVEFILLENVLGIRDSKHSGRYNSLLAGIKSLGFDVAENELCAFDFGVPQMRRRVILCGIRKNQGYTSPQIRTKSGLETVRDAIGGLAEPVFFRHGLTPKDIPVHPNHWTMVPRSARFKKPLAISNDGRSFKKLHWDVPSPTVAYGHREIHVHPNGRRRLSIFEAMLLQGFPPSFILEGNLSEQVEQISNAVPPPLARSVAVALKRSLSGR